MTGSASRHSTELTKVVVIFYGLPRSLRWTASSINLNAIAPLRTAGIEVVQVAHFNAPRTINNIRSAELNIPFPHPNYDLLDLECILVERQDDASIADLLEVFREHDLGAETGLSSHRNLLHALNSLKKAWKLAASFPAHAYIFLRADLEYIDPLPVSDIISRLLIGEIDFACPSWHSWGGLNDRVAFASSKAAAAYASRIDRIVDVVRLSEPRNSEQILAWLFDALEIRVGLFEARALRVRADGRTQAEGFDLGIPRRLSNRCRWELGRRGISLPTVRR